MEDNKHGKKEYKVTQERTPGELVAARRKKLGWSQEDLEWRSGVSRVQISRIERDLVRPTYETIEGLEKALKIPLHELFIQYRKEHVVEKQDGRVKRRAIKKFLQRVEAELEAGDELDEYLDQAIKAMKMAKLESHNGNKSENKEPDAVETLKNEDCVHKK